MRTLVLGGSTPVGQQVVRRLTALGRPVLVLDERESDAPVPHRYVDLHDPAAVVAEVEILLDDGATLVACVDPVLLDALADALSRRSSEVPVVAVADEHARLDQRVPEEMHVVRHRPLDECFVDCRGELQSLGRDGCADPDEVASKVLAAVRAATTAPA